MEQPFNLSPAGLSGLSELLHMMYQCIRDVSRQLHTGDTWQTAAAFNDYLRVHPEAEEALRVFLERAEERGFTGWREIPLEGGPMQTP